MSVIEALLRGLGSAAEQSACPAAAWSTAATRTARANDDSGNSAREFLNAFAARQEANVGRRRQNLLQRVVDLLLSPHTPSRASKHALLQPHSFWPDCLSFLLLYFTLAQFA